MPNQPSPTLTSLPASPDAPRGLSWQVLGESRHLVLVGFDGLALVTCGLVGSSYDQDLPCPDCLAALFDAQRQTLWAE